eukprot:TRINITY_DN4042_c0_g1_i1.p1 TRINITY_DN4042_c0_g1~~TRINITY_DN4042_c0_g1_i1.p1  ORF type:complete len:487 (+),score=67.16 TRINITY_DN4042_c0_g1_i1:94-1554(+)
MSLQVLLLFFLFLLLLAVYLKRNLDFQVPGPLGIPILGPLEIFTQPEMHKVLLNFTKKYGKFWSFTFGARSFVNFTDPELLEQVLKTHFKDIQRSSARHDEMYDLLGDGIFTSAGDTWKSLRKMATPLFKVKNIKESMIPSFFKHANVVLEKLKNTESDRIEIFSITAEYTMNTFLEIGLGAEHLLSAKQKQQFATDFNFMQECTFSRATLPFWKFIPNPRGLSLALKNIDTLVYSVIDQRKKESRQELLKKTDILSKCLIEEDNEGKPYNDKFLRDIFLNLLLAGRDTTASFIGWTLFVLSQHQDVEKKVLEEISKVVKGTFATYEELEEMKYTRQVLSETLRLFSPVPINSRTAQKDIVLSNGYVLKKGTIVGIHPYVVGRDPDLWENPERFDPDRFSPEKMSKQHPFAFIPFHAGPQLCLGKEVAYFEAKAFLSLLLPNFKFEFVQNQNLVCGKSLILVPQHGMYMTFKPREKINQFQHCDSN